MDDLMDDLEIKGKFPDQVFGDRDDGDYKVYFQFGEGKEVQLATIFEGNTFTLVLDAKKNSEPAINFTDGEGNHFKLFLKKCI